MRRGERLICALGVLSALTCLLGCGSIQSDRKRVVPSETPIKVPNEEAQEEMVEVDLSSTEHLNDESLPPCSAEQTALFERGLASTSTYVEEFIKGMAQFDQMPRSEADPLGLRRSQMVIFFGDGFLKRVQMIKQAMRPLQRLRAQNTLSQSRGADWKIIKPL